MTLQGRVFLGGFGRSCHGRFRTPKSRPINSCGSISQNRSLKTWLPFRFILFALFTLTQILGFSAPAGIFCSIRSPRSARQLSNDPTEQADAWFHQQRCQNYCAGRLNEFQWLDYGRSPQSTVLSQDFLANLIQWKKTLQERTGTK